MQGTKQIAQRIQNAENNFISTIVDNFGKTKNEAIKVLNEYKKAKVIKLDAVNGVYKIKHGAFMELEVIENAINL